MKANYHTHTYRCKHAQGTEEDYTLSAIKSGLSYLGFSDHAPFPDQDFGLRMSYQELDDYILTIDTLTQKYSTDIILLKSLEIEYLPEYSSYYEILLKEKMLDYLLLGEHFFRTTTDEFVNITNVQNTSYYVEYAKAVVQAIETGLFKIIAHPDIFLMNHFAWDNHCEIASDLIIDAAEKTHTILEYNANGYRRGIHEFPDGKRFQYPHKRFWEKVGASKISVIIGSDCHNPSQVWDHAIDTSFKELDLLGIKPLRCMP